jgi:omega-hydroxy-beta-dihydromenaquinone-9 sulfotransferase
MSASAAVEGLLAGGEKGGACWYAPTLWHTMSLTAWWQLLASHGFRLQAERWREVSAVTLSSACNSLLGLLQDALHGAQLRATCVRYDPVFVLGHWRAGTTHLHELLALDGRFAYPTAVECYAPHHCLISERLFPGLLSRWLLRAPVPGGSTPYLYRPQEDELALLAMGAPTPMWSLAYPGEEQGHAYLTLRAVSLEQLERWEAILWKFVQLVTYRNPGRRLVLKSPAHTARLGLLARLFPQARFVHIVRDPYVVFAQTVRMWRQIQAASALLPPERFNVERYVLRTLREMYAGFESAASALPPGRFHQLYYEQLVRDPMQTLAECYRVMELGGFEEARPRIESYLAPLTGKGFIDDPVGADGKEAVAEAWGPIFRRWGYAI